MIPRPTHNWIFFKRRDFKRETKSGIIIPDQATKPMAEVIAVGPGKTLPSGQVAPVCCKKGDLILLNVDRLQGLIHEVNLPGEETLYMIMDEGGVVGGVWDAADADRLEAEFAANAPLVVATPQVVVTQGDSKIVLQ